MDGGSIANKVVEAVAFNEDTLQLVLEVFSQDQASVKRALPRLQEQLQQPDLNQGVVCACLLQFVRSRVAHLTHRTANDARVPDSPASARQLEASAERRGLPGTPTARAEGHAAPVAPPAASDPQPQQRPRRQQPEPTQQGEGWTQHDVPSPSPLCHSQPPPRALHGSAWPALPTPTSGTAPANPFAPGTSAPALDLELPAARTPTWPTPTESHGPSKAGAISTQAGSSAQQQQSAAQPSPAHSVATSTGRAPSTGHAPSSSAWGEAPGAGTNTNGVAGGHNVGGPPGPAVKLHGAWAARGGAAAAPVLASISGQKQSALARRLQGESSSAQQGSSSGRTQAAQASTPVSRSGGGVVRRMQPTRAEPVSTPNSSTAHTPPPGFGAMTQTPQSAASSTSNFTSPVQAAWPSLGQTQATSSSQGLSITHSQAQSQAKAQHAGRPAATTASSEGRGGPPGFAQHVHTPASTQSASALWPALGGGAASSTSLSKRGPRRITPEPQQPQQLLVPFDRPAQLEPQLHVLPNPAPAAAPAMQEQARHPGAPAEQLQVQRQGSVEEPQTPASSSAPKLKRIAPVPTPVTPAATLLGAGAPTQTTTSNIQPFTSSALGSGGSDLSFRTAYSQGGPSAVAGTSPVLAHGSGASHQGSLSFSGMTGTPSYVTGTHAASSVTGPLQLSSPLPVKALLQTPAGYTGGGSSRFDGLLPSPASVTSRMPPGPPPPSPDEASQTWRDPSQTQQDSSQTQPSAASVNGTTAAAEPPSTGAPQQANTGTEQAAAMTAAASTRAGGHLMRQSSMGGVGGPTATIGLDTQGQLLIEFVRLARAHAALLSVGCVPLGFSIHEEAMLLVTLLSLPPTTSSNHSSSRACSAPPSPAPALPQPHGSSSASGVLTHSWPVALASTYACAVLEQCTAVVCGMGRKLCGLLIELPTVRLRCPRLVAGLEGVLAAQRAHAAPFRPYDQLQGAKPVALVGLLRTPGDCLLVSGSAGGIGTEGGAPSASALAGKARGMEAQRRAANRERVRDAFFSLARDASSLATSLAHPACSQDAVVQEIKRRAGLAPAAAPTAGTNTPGGCPSPVSLVDGLLSVRARSMELLAATHPDNLTFLAELFTGCILQAAATGEAVMDGAVATLAQRDTSRFQRLSQRLQVQGASTVTPAPRALKPGMPTRASGGVGGAAGSSTITPQSGQQGSIAGGWDTPGTGGVSTGGGGASKDAAFAVCEKLAGVLRVLPDFAGVQHAYVLFLEACDSRALALALGKCMTSKLHALLTSLPGWGTSSTGGSSTSDVAAAALVDAAGTDAAPTARRRGSSSGECGDGGVEEEGGRRGAVEGSSSPHVLATGRAQGSAGSGLPALPAVAGLSPKVLSEQVVAMVTLSCFLSYLTHVAHLGSGHQEELGLTGLAPHGSSPWSLGPLSDQQEGGGPVPECSWPGPALDIPSLLHASMRHGMLPATLPCVAQLLGFVHHDPQRLRVGQLRRALLQLCALRLSPALSPAQPRWGGAAACVRSILDDLLARLAAVCPAAVLEAEAAAARQLTLAAGTAAADTAHPSTSMCIAASPRASPGTLGDAGEGAATASSRPVHSDKVDKSPPAVARAGASGAYSSHQLQLNSAHLTAGILRWDALVDARLLEVCCPGLDGCCASLQRAVTVMASQAPAAAAQHARAGGSGSDGGAGTQGAGPGSTPGKHEGSTASHVVPRKISVTALPGSRSVSQPGLGSGAVTMGGRAGDASRHIPPSLAAVLQAPEGGAQIQLQQALLAQYSTDEQPVKLKEIVGFVSDLLAVNAVTATMPAVAPAALSNAAAQLSLAGTRLQEGIVRQRAASQPATGAVTDAGSRGVAGGGPPTSPLPPLISASPASTSGPNSAMGGQRGMASQRPGAPVAQVFSPLELERVKGQLSGTAEEVARRAVRSLLEAAEPLCWSHIAQAAQTALPALLPPSLPPPARQAAARVVTHNAMVACAHRLVSQVHAMVRQQLMQQVDPMARTLLKQAAAAAAATQQLPSSPLPPSTTSPLPTQPQLQPGVHEAAADLLLGVQPIRTSGRADCAHATQAAGVQVLPAPLLQREASSGSVAVADTADSVKAAGTSQGAQPAEPLPAACGSFHMGAGAGAVPKAHAAAVPADDDVARMCDQAGVGHTPFGEKPKGAAGDPLLLPCASAEEPAQKQRALVDKVVRTLLQCVLLTVQPVPQGPLSEPAARDAREAAVQQLRTSLLPLAHELDAAEGCARGSAGSCATDLLQAGASPYVRSAAAAAAAVLHRAVREGGVGGAELEAVLCAALDGAAKRHVPGTWPGIRLPPGLLAQRSTAQAAAGSSSTDAPSPPDGGACGPAAVDQLMAWVALEVLRHHAAACRTTPVWHSTPGGQLPSLPCPQLVEPSPAVWVDGAQREGQQADGSARHASTLPTPMLRLPGLLMELARDVGEFPLLQGVRLGMQQVSLGGLGFM